jgi:hypothetical protein
VAGRTVLRGAASEELAASVDEFVQLAGARALVRLDHDVVIADVIGGLGLVPYFLSECHHRDLLVHL